MDLELLKAAGDGNIEDLREKINGIAQDDSEILDKALVKASEKQHWECVKILVEAGADVNGGGSWKALNFASFYNNVECVDLLLKAGADVNHFNNTTCLNLTTDVKVAQLLITAGADVNRNTYDDCFTPVTSAAESGKADLIQLLIGSGADVNSSSTYGTALSRAVYRGYTDCVKVLAPLVTETDKQQSYLLAASCGLIDCLKVFIELGEDINRKFQVYEQQESNHVNVMMKAASGNQIECIEFLIQLGARVEECDDYGSNMLMFAAKECKFEAMEYFIKKCKIDVNACNDRKETALHKVIDQPYVFYGLMGTSTTDQNDNNYECVKLLIESGADVNKKNGSGDTALILSAEQNQPDYIKLLLKAGARINTFNFYMLDVGSFNAYMRHVEKSKRKNEDLKLMLLAAGESRREFQQRKVLGAEGLVKEVEQISLNEAANDERSFKGNVDIDWACWTDENDTKEDVKSLKEYCRDQIRKHLLVLDPYKNLFQRTPLLGLPTSLNSYLLYDVDLRLNLSS